MNRILAQTAAVHAREAYTRPNVWGGNGQAVVDPERGIVSIAGTNGLRDAMQDLNRVPHDIGQGAKVHAGFWEHYEQLRVPLFDAMDKSGALYEGQGHSLGAAVFTLAIYRIPSMFAGSTVHLFGCPKVGNSNFAQIFNRICKDAKITVWNVQGIGDTFCHLPAIGDWAHVGTVVKIGKAYLRADHPIERYIEDLS